MINIVFGLVRYCTQLYSSRVCPVLVLVTVLRVVSSVGRGAVLGTRPRTGRLPAASQWLKIVSGRRVAAWQTDLVHSAAAAAPGRRLTAVAAVGHSVPTGAG